MLALQFVREHTDAVRRALERRNTTAPLDEILALDARRRERVTELDRLRAEVNAASKAIGAAKDPAERQQRIEAIKGVSDSIKVLEAEVRIVEEELDSLVAQLPNIPADDVPDASDESGNVVVASEGTPREFDFEPKPHWDLGEALRLIDFERGTRLSGTRFYVLRGAGARLERALIAWMIDLHVRRHGYTELALPAVVKEEILFGAGQLPKFRDNLYRDVEDDLWLIPTAEVPITGMHRDEIVDGRDLPFRYVAQTPCFRREQMSAGRDVRGIKRVHQFNKVEMYKFCLPEASDGELTALVQEAADVLRALDLAFRTVQLCTGDLGFGAVKSFDLEVWAPGCKEWLEVSSCSDCGPFQARRSNIRFRRVPGAPPEFVHTLNGSGLALPRVIIAVMENYQQPDGTIAVPEVLRPYMDGQAIITGP